MHVRPVVRTPELVDILIKDGASLQRYGSIGKLCVPTLLHLWTLPKTKDEQGETVIARGKPCFFLGLPRSLSLSVCVY